jgi:hypothetical protein
MQKAHSEFVAHGPFRVESFSLTNACQITLVHRNHDTGDVRITLFLRDSDHLEAMLAAFDTTHARES